MPRQDSVCGIGDRAKMVDALGDVANAHAEEQSDDAIGHGDGRGEGSHESVPSKAVLERQQIRWAVRYGVGQDGESEKEQLCAARCAGFFASTLDGRDQFADRKKAAAIAKSFVHPRVMTPILP